MGGLSDCIGRSWWYMLYAESRALQEELLPHWSRQLGRDHIFIFSDQGMNFFPDRPKKKWEALVGDGVPSSASCLEVRLRVTMILQKQRGKLEYR